MMRNAKTLGFLIALNLLVVYLIWGSTYLAIKLCVKELDPLIMCGIRFLLAGIILVIFLFIKKEKFPAKKQVAYAFLPSAFMMLGGTGAVAIAEQWVSSGLAAVAIAMTPLWACLITGLLKKKWPNYWEWIGISVGIIGIGLLNSDGQLRATFGGAFFLLLAPLCWAIGSIMLKNIEASISGMMSNALTMLWGGLLCLLVGLISGERFSVNFSIETFFSLWYLIVFGSLIGFSSYMYLFRNTRPALATSYSYVNPVIAVLLGLFLGNETMSLVGWFALSMAVIGVFFVIKGQNEFGGDY